MIARSLASFIGSATDLTSLGLLQSVAKTPDLAESELQAPCAFVMKTHEMSQELWSIGDAQRQERPFFNVLFCATSDEQARQFEARFRRLIETATTTDTSSQTHPGIDFKAFADKLIDSGDHKTYISNQPGWFSSPAPIIYKNEDTNGEPVVVTSGYSVDSTTGQVTFNIANAAADRIRATYKIGVIDFNIAGVSEYPTEQFADIVNLPGRYVVVFTLEAFYYVKSKSNRYL